MKVTLVGILAISIFLFVFLQSANAQSENATKFTVSTLSVFLGQDNTIKEITNSTQTVQNVEDVLKLTGDGLKGEGKYFITLNNSTQVVDNDIAQPVLEKELLDIEKKNTNLPSKGVSIFQGWIYFGNPPEGHHIILE